MDGWFCLCRCVEVSDYMHVDFYVEVINWTLEFHIFKLLNLLFFVLFDVFLLVWIRLKIDQFTNSHPIGCTPLCIIHEYVVSFIGIIRDDKDKFKCLYLLVETAVAVRQREKEQEDIPVLGNWETALNTNITASPTSIAFRLRHAHFYWTIIVCIDKSIKDRALWAVEIIWYKKTLNSRNGRIVTIGERCTGQSHDTS